MPDKPSPHPTALSRRSLLKLAAAGVGFAGLGGCTTVRTRADIPASFDWGVASGDPTADSVVLWTRAVPTEGQETLPVSFELARDAQFDHILRQGTVRTSVGRDYTVKIDVTDLEPGQTYYYRFRAGNRLSTTGRTRTLPRKDTTKIRFALASCANYASGFYHAYREISVLEDLDAVIHVGDYIYEYAANEYDGEIGRQIGRVPEPAHEILTLADYRARFACYRRDEDLQAAHAAAPFITVWDDHETANNSYREGASNHDPKTEGSWLARRDAALQAYFEWLPMRDPVPGKPAERLNRRYDFGDIATLLVIESRLTGRDQQLSLTRDMVYRENGEPDLEAFETDVLNEPSRSLLGPKQEEWLASELQRSADRDISWQVLANQTVMSPMRTPDFRTLLPDSLLDSIKAQGGYLQRWLDRSAWGMPVNLDSWDGYPAARERLYTAAEAAGARLAVLSGDSHMFWANDLYADGQSQPVGIEFATAGITSPGGYEALGDDPAIFDIAAKGMVDKNKGVRFANVKDRGFIELTLTRATVEAKYHRMSSIVDLEYEDDVFLTVRANRQDDGTVSALNEVG